MNPRCCEIERLVRSSPEIEWILMQWLNSTRPFNEMEIRSILNPTRPIRNGPMDINSANARIRMFRFVMKKIRYPIQILKKFS